MDKNRDGNEKSRSGSGLPAGMDPMTAALYAPWLQTEQALLSNMLGSSGLGAYAAAAAMQGLGSMHPSYPSTSTSANLASIAAAQQAHQAAALASLGPSAATWYNLAGMQQMELLSRLQGSMAGAYGGIHPEHLMNLELLQAQQAALTAAALSGKGSTSRTNSNSSSNSSPSLVRSATPTNSKASRSTPSSRSGTPHRSPRDHLASLVASRTAAKEAERHARQQRSDLVSGASSNLSYGIASLMSDKHPSSKSNSRPPSRPSENMRSKELEIIPLAGNKKSLDEQLDLSSNGIPEGSVLAAHLSSKTPYQDSKSKNDSDYVGLPSTFQNFLKKHDEKKSRPSTNGLSSLSSSQVSIEPLLRAASSSDDGPVDLSLKPTSSKSQGKTDKSSRESTSELLSKLKPPNPYDYAQGMGLNLLPEMAPSLEVLQNLYGQGQSRDILASMQEALQRQLLMGDSKKQDERKKRPKMSVDDGAREERIRHLGRGVSKPKKNTVASLLEHCRAAGIKPKLPLPSTSVDTPISCAPTSVTTSPPHHTTPVSPVRAGSSCSTPPHMHSTPNYSSKAVVVSTPCSSPTSPPPAAPSNSSTPLLPFPLSLTPSVSMSPIPSLAHDASIDLPKPGAVTSNSSQAKNETTPTRPDSRTSNPAKTTIGGSETETEITSESSSDEEHHSYIHPWLNTDSDGHSRHSTSPPTKKRKMVTDESLLRVPLQHGWKRETTMRGVTQSGVRGEVVYVAPCGKVFKQYPDIMRYLERQNITEISRNNFSFSSKIPVGDYIDAATQQTYTEGDVRQIVNNIRAQRGGAKCSQEKNSKRDE